jgi:hypothetical protein
MEDLQSENPRYSTSVDRIKSARDIFDIASFHPSDRTILYRGQSVDKPLLPKIARLAKEHELPNPEVNEKELLRTFQSMCLPILNTPPPSTDWDWMAIARHHGLPTRLLDWTSNAFFALWFALGNENEDSDQRVLYVLEASKKDLKLPGPDKSVFSLRRTFAFQPPHISRNIAAQSAWFTVHKYIEEKNNYVPLEKNKNFGHKLTKHFIDKKSVPKLRREMKHLGISHFSLFPDLDHLSKHLEHDLIARVKGI